MKFGSITSRMCHRCGSVGIAPHDEYIQTDGSTVNLCADCTKWKDDNPDKIVQKK